MSLIQNIKLNYKLKVLDELFEKKSFEELKEILAKEKKDNPNIYFQLLKNYDAKFLKETNYSDFYDKKINWLISYDLDSIEIVSSFLDFYFSKFAPSKFQNEYYLKVLSKELSYFSSDFSQINFEQIIKNSSLFQTIILLSTEYDYNFFQSTGAFFEAKQFNNLFTNPNMSNSFIYILSDPFLLFKKYKEKFNSSEAALNEICNFNNETNKYFSKSDDNKIFEDVRKSWNVNVKSWTDPNVINSFKGLIVRYEDIIANPEENFVQILYHLKQSGEKIDVEYSIVTEYLDNFRGPIIEKNSLSNKEIKIIRSNLDKALLEEYNY